MEGFLCTPEFYWSLDRLDSLAYIRALPGDHFRASALIEYATGSEDMSAYCEPYVDEFYKLS